MSNIPIGISPSGAILLGPDVTCDGFHRDYKVRVQTHIHLDHMDNFERSKGYQDIYLTKPTLKLLIAEHDAELSVRQNLKVVEYGRPVSVGCSRITLLSSGHMLGAAQVMVELETGYTLGYSGDFQWPMESPIKVNTLILDSTYGSPKSIRQYTQEEAEDLFRKTVREKLVKGPVYLRAHRGTLERSLQLLAERIQCTVLASEKFIRTAMVYREYGYTIGEIVSIESPEAKEIISPGRFVRIYGQGDRLPVDIGHGTTIIVSAYMTKPNSPVIEHSDRSLSIALSDHADFYSTLEYIEATGAKNVITDNYRGGKAVELAIQIKKILGICATPSTLEFSREWGI